MRKQAEKLEVGKWYAENKNIEDMIFLRFHSFTSGMPNFDKASQELYGRDENGLIGFVGGGGFYEVTEEELTRLLKL